jgi:uracil phosphoribosyltransferase
VGNVLESRHPLVRHKLSVLRGTDTGVRRFRELTWEISVLLGYEALADLALTETEVTTPLQRTEGYTLACVPDWAW